MAEAEATQIYLIIAVAIVAMLIMAGAIVLFVVLYQKRMIREQMKRQAMEFSFQQRMLEAELQSQETERRRLAGDLHDSIGGMLSTIRVGISTLGKDVADSKLVDQTKQMLDDTISSVRRISRDLMPATLEKFGLSVALQELCERFHSTSGIDIDFHEDGEVRELDKNRQLMIYRIVQELLNNAVKHSQASVIRVHLAVGQTLNVFVEDDGVGFDPLERRNGAESTKSLGLFNIDNRVRILGAKLEFEIGRAKGTKASLTIPLHHEQKT